MTSDTTLVVTEKPDAALHVAEALSGKTKPKKLSVGGVPFFEVSDNKERILVCSALGHLYAVDAEGKEPRSRYPVWNFTWKPKHLVERAKYARRGGSKQYQKFPKKRTGSSTHAITIWRGHSSAIQF